MVNDVVKLSTAHEHNGLNGVDTMARSGILFLHAGDIVRVGLTGHLPDYADPLMLSIFIGFLL